MVQPYLVHWPVSVNADVSTSGVNREAFLKRGYAGAFNSGTHNALSEQCAYLYGKVKSKTWEVLHARPDVEEMQELISFLFIVI